MHSVESLRRAAVIGTGMMGPGIAATLALGGLETVLISRKSETAAQGLAKAAGCLDVLEKEQLVPAGQLQRARRLLSASADLEAAVGRVQLVIESGPEDLEFKRELFARLDAITEPDAILASNTSGLSITAIASACQRPERVLTTHFWNPPHLMPLVEIVQAQQTDPAIALVVRELMLQCGKTPVMVRRDTPGQLGNRLQMALVREAVHIVEQGIASVEDVDLAIKTGFGLRLPVYGVLEHMDMVGIDLGFRVLDYVAQDLNSEPRAPSLMREKLERGELGVKAGKGFYDWSKRDAQVVVQRRDRFLIDFLKRHSGSIQTTNSAERSSEVNQRACKPPSKEW